MTYNFGTIRVRIDERNTVHLQVAGKPRMRDIRALIRAAQDYKISGKSVTANVPRELEGACHLALLCGMRRVRQKLGASGVIVEYRL